MFKDRKKLNKNRLRPKSTLIHEPKVYKSKSQKVSKARSKKVLSLVLNRSVYAFIALLVLISSLYLLLKVRSNTNALDNNISNTGFVCNDYKPDAVLNSVLRVKKDKAGNLSDFNLIIYNKDKAVSVNFNDTTFNIDKNGKVGTLKEYFNLNKTYLSEDLLVKNLPNLFLSEFYIKVDNLILESGYRFDTYMMQKDAPFYSKLSSTKKISETDKIKTTVCTKSWSDFMNDYTKVIKWNNTNINYKDDFKVVDYFLMSEVKKEQIRVQIINKSGVENLGIFYQRFMENYGINIVKNDESTDVISKTHITQDNTKNTNKNTVGYVQYVLGREGKVEDAANLFSDLSVELGQDSVINY
jgi:hypothetical protein